MSDVDKVRALYGDLAPDENGDFLIGDAAIALYLDVTDGNILRAAALAVRAIAVDEILLKAYLKTDDLSVDGVRGAAELRIMAKDFESRAREHEIYEGDYGAALMFPVTGHSRVPKLEDGFTCR